MTDCFWTRDVGCYDPSCGAAPTTLYFVPGGRGSSTTPGVYTNSALTVVAPTFSSAVITQYDLYDATSVMCCGCDYAAWCGCGVCSPTIAPYTSTGTASPPVGGLIGSNTSEFPYTLLSPSALNGDYTEVYNKVHLISIVETMLNVAIGVVHITTDVGSGLLVLSDLALGCE